jgi:hypothetical protein
MSLEVVIQADPDGHRQRKADAVEPELLHPDEQP